MAGSKVSRGTFLVLVSSHSERTGKEKSQCFRLRLETREISIDRKW